MHEEIKPQIKELYAVLKDLFAEEEQKKIKFKDVQDFLREEIAEALNIIKSSGEPDKGKIKTGVVKKAIEVISEERNRVEEEMALLESYLEVLRKMEDGVNDYLIHSEELKEVKDEIKEAKKKLKNLLGGDTLAMDLILTKAKKGSIALPPEEKIHELKELLEGME